MKIVKDFPPNIKDIEARFGVLPQGVIFTYGDILYRPYDVGFIDQPLMVHEETHTKQQGDSPDKWWVKYLSDDNFRLSQEIEAYQNQYKEMKVVYKDRNKVFLGLNKIAKDLSSSIYGNVISFEDAIKIIRGERVIIK